MQRRSRYRSSRAIYLLNCSILSDIHDRQHPLEENTARLPWQEIEGSFINFLSAVSPPRRKIDAACFVVSPSDRRSSASTKSIRRKAISLRLDLAPALRIGFLAADFAFGRLERCFIQSSRVPQHLITVENFGPADYTGQFSTGSPSRGCDDFTVGLDGRSVDREHVQSVVRF